MAQGLNMSRSQLFNYRIGRCKSHKERDADLVALIERDAATGRKASLDLLKIEVERAAAARREQKEARDAAQQQRERGLHPQRRAAARAAGDLRLFADGG
jgi:hypothetical protein